MEEKGVQEDDFTWKKGCAGCLTIGAVLAVCGLAVGGIVQCMEDRAAERRAPTVPVPVPPDDPERIVPAPPAAPERDLEELEAARERARARLEERRRQEAAATERRAQAQREAAAREREQNADAREALAWRQTIFDTCASMISTRTPVMEQKACFDEGRFLYYCWLGPPADYCENEYSSGQCRGCGQNARLQGRVSETLSALGWRGFLGPRFRAVR